MSLFDLPIDEAKEPEVVPEGIYTVSIWSVDQRTAKSGRPMLVISLKNLSNPNGQMIYHNLLGVLPDDEPGTRNAILLNGKRFCKCFGLTPPLDPVAMEGAEGQVLLTVEEDNNGVPRNRIAKFL